MAEEKNIAIKVDSIEKDFVLNREATTSIKSGLIRTIKRDKHRLVKNNFRVLKGVSFDIEEGDFFGIVGRNGGGKSTLLKIIAGIYRPTKGKVTINGTLIPFIELGVGFNPELTGRENVYLNGALFGFSRKEIDAMYDDIVDFAELHKFMDQKLKNYSSGMQVRLAFSVAIKAQGDILVLDEVLAVGDEAFQKKCQDYFYKLKKEGKTVVLVTHSMDSVRSFCNKAVLIDKGTIVASGNPDKVASRYSEIFQEEYARELQKQKEANPKAVKQEEVYLESVKTLQHDKEESALKFGEDFSINLDVISDAEYDDVAVGVHIVHQSGQTVAAITSKTFYEKLQLRKGKNTFSFTVQNIFSEGNYSLNIAIKQRTMSRFLVQVSDSYPFAVVGVDAAKYNPSSFVYPDIKMGVKSES